MIELAHCNIKFEPWGVRVVFPDGLYADGTPHPGMPHYHVIAHRCGYGDDLVAYCREHDFAHAFVEERLHYRPSRVLRGIATGRMISGEDAAYEEAFAQMFQRWVRANERPLLAGVDWDALKREALGLLDGS
jgi:hypothetical protein